MIILNIETLTEKLATRKRLNEKMLEELNQLFNPIIELLKEHNFIYSNTISEEEIEIKNYMSSNNYGNWGWEIIINRNILPSKYENIDSSGYWCGNFDCEYSYMSRREIRFLAENAEKIIMSIIEKIDNINQKSEEALNKIPKISIIK